LLQVSAPGADANQDGQDIDFSFVNLENSSVDQDYQQNGLNDSNHTNDSITYLTPKFNGFQAGATYSAAVDQKVRGNGLGVGNTGGMATDNDASEFESQLEFGARYDGEFNGVGVHAGAGYTTIDREVEVATDDNFQEWNAGLKLTYNNFGFGGAYNTDNSAVAQDGDRDNWTVGADYTWGAYKFGASYFSSKAETGATTEDDLDRYMVGATYTFGPGMDFRGAVGYYDLDDTTPAEDNQATVVTVGTDIQF
jgi:predicted porin